MTLLFNVSIIRAGDADVTLGATRIERVEFNKRRQPRSRQVQSVYKSIHNRMIKRNRIENIKDKKKALPYVISPECNFYLPKCLFLSQLVTVSLFQMSHGKSERTSFTKIIFTIIYCRKNLTIKLLLLHLFLHP